MILQFQVLNFLTLQNCLNYRLEDRLTLDIGHVQPGSLQDRLISRMANFFQNLYIFGNVQTFKWSTFEADQLLKLTIDFEDEADFETAPLSKLVNFQNRSTSKTSRLLLIVADI
jgi:hypothetical protein